jgi:hypothetical protein
VQVGNYGAIISAPSIPGANSLTQDFQMVGIELQRKAVRKLNVC